MVSFIYIKITRQGWIQHSLVEGGGARPTLVPNVIGFSAMHSALRVTHLSAVFDNGGNLMILLLTNEMTVSHFASADFYCAIIKNSPYRELPPVGNSSL